MSEEMVELYSYTVGEGVRAIDTNQSGYWDRDTLRVPKRFHALMELDHYRTRGTTRFHLKQVGAGLLWPMSIDLFHQLLLKQGTVAPGLFDGLWEVRIRSGHVSLAMVPVEEV